MTSIELLADALAAYRSGDRDQAAELARRAGSPLAGELRIHLAGDSSVPVYDQPEAFTAFIRGGGNVELYRRLSEELAARYDAAKPESLLDLGCGDGLAGVRALQPRTGTLVLAEFDVPEFAEGSPEHLRSLVARYERGVAEYGADASLVAQGFLLPVLLGIVSGQERTNWEHPAAVWAGQLKTAGFTDVDVEPLADYWWSPAVLITAC